ncbi:MAG: 2Fe-2S iron-sulfur cluster-binding protein, partial [Anaerolineae bacterium]
MTNGNTLLDNMVTVVIDGKEVAVPVHSTVLDAARRLGIPIPTLCHYAKLIPVGACRMCLVEVEKMRGLQTACTTEVRPGMVVRTDTPEIRKARAANLEFLLTNHPLDCPVCDKGGECELQDQTFIYGPGKSRFIEEKRHKAKARVLGPYIILDQERCVLCRRCIRFLEEWADDVQLGLFERGRLTYVDTFNGEPFNSPFSGNTVHLCPVGALTSRVFRFSARVWELKRTPSVCLDCAVGCNISLDTKYNRLKRIVSREHPDVNDEWLCDRGQFDHRPADAALRVAQPLVRKGDELKPATWEEALERVVGALREAVQAHGAAGAALIGSPAHSNEANYLLQRLA